MKHARTKATMIPRSVKEEVFDRDGGVCVLCGRPGFPNAHYIPRSAGGRGDTPRNIITVCTDCHRAYDEGPLRWVLADQIREYLKSCYEDWDENGLVYQKWPEELQMER